MHILGDTKLVKNHILNRYKWICASNPLYLLTHLINPLVIGILGLVTVVLSIFASVLDYFPGDIAVFNWVQSFSTPWLDTTMQSISIFGDTIPQLIVSVAILGIIFLTIGKLESVLFGFGIGTAFLLNKVLKFVIDRPRPDLPMMEVISKLDIGSFPSGHVMHMTVLVGILTVVVYKNVSNKYSRMVLLISFFNLWAGTGISRIYLGVHWLSDVIGGFLWGILALYLIFLVYKKTIHRRHDSSDSL